MTSPRYRAVITDCDYPDVEQQRTVLEAAGADLIWENFRTEDALIAGLTGAEVLLTQYAPLTARVIDSLDACRGIVRYGVGYDTVDLEAAARRGIWVCNVPDYGTDEVSDHAVTMLLVIARKIVPMANGVQQGAWGLEHIKPVGRLRGRTLGIIGLGRIGALTAAKAKGFGIRVIACDPHLPSSVFTDLHVERADLDGLLAESDYVSIHAPLSPETHHLMSDRTLALMKPGAFLINTARGGLVDADALGRALRSGHLGGAAIDVTETEPIPRDSPLLGLDNCIVTPHAAWYSEEASSALQRLAAEEAVRLLRGDPPRCPVNRLA